MSLNGLVWYREMGPDEIVMQSDKNHRRNEGSDYEEYMYGARLSVYNVRWHSRVYVVLFCPDVISNNLTDVVPNSRLWMRYYCITVS